jgi:hypothetical protein
VSKDVHISVIGIDFEPPLHWLKPAIDHSAHGKPALPEPERERLLFAAITGVALHANRHATTIRSTFQHRTLDGCERPDLASSEFIQTACRVDGRFDILEVPKYRDIAVGDRDLASLASGE